MTFMLLIAAAAVSHTLPDGVIDRGAQVTVRPNVVEVRYEIVASAATLRKELSRRGIEGADEIPDEEVFQRFGDEMLPIVGRELRVSVDGEKKPLRPQSAEIAGRHHIRVELHYRLPLTATWSALALEVVDDIFLKQPGYQRMGLVGRDGVRIIESTAAVDLRRVPRIPLSEMTPDQRRGARCIRARVDVQRRDSPDDAQTSFSALDSIVALSSLGCILVGATYAVVRARSFRQISSRGSGVRKQPTA